MAKRTIEAASIGLASIVLDNLMSTFDDGEWDRFDCDTLYDCFLVAVRSNHFYRGILNQIASCLDTEGTENQNYDDVEAMRKLRLKFWQELDKRKIYLSEQ